jgi:Domain of unknown function (DUF834).
VAARGPTGQWHGGKEGRRRHVAADPTARIALGPIGRTAAARQPRARIGINADRPTRASGGGACASRRRRRHPAAEATRKRRQRAAATTQSGGERGRRRRTGKTGKEGRGDASPRVAGAREDEGGRRRRTTGGRRRLADELRRALRTKKRGIRERGIGHGDRNPWPKAAAKAALTRARGERAPAKNLDGGGADEVDLGRAKLTAATARDGGEPSGG